MTTLQSLLVAAALAIGMSAPVSAAQSDPEVIIYRFPGVRDFGNGFTGVATVFFCTNFSGATENIRFVTRNFDAALASNVVLPIAHLATISESTHPTLVYSGASLQTGGLSGGTTAIAATSINIICTAETIDAS